MPRNSSGVYTLPSGNPVVPGTTIDAAWANDTMEDMANELTNSLSRTGAGGMLAPFRIADGLVTGPGLSYLNETNTGLYRSGAGSTWMAVLGVNTVQFSTVGLTIPFGKALTAQGNASVTGTLSVTGGTTLASSLAVGGAITATGGVLGNVTAASGTSTFNNVTINGNLDMDAGSSGTITNLPNPVNPGDAANKAYVDAQDALRLALTGGTMTGAIAMSNNKVTGLATPTADQDAATKAYVDSIAQGIDAKASCRAATTANITLSGNQTIDGVAVVAGDRVLVKNQSSAAENGIYVAAASTWSRAADANTWDELVAAYTFIENGTDNGNNGYICTIAPGGTLGVTAVTWAQFSGAGQITAGQGLSKTGNTIQVNTASSSRIVIGADDIDLATTGVTASTYKSVTVDQWGRVTGGTNPTTLAGFGIGDAYTQSQTDTLLNAKLNTAGGTMSGAIAMGTNKITGLGDPTLAQDAATKNYIDTIFGSTTTAAASASAAASSASAASSSASSASGSASAAATSATSAAASFDSFDDRYLGAKSSDPTVDNDGNALITGALYFNSVANEMRVYSGSAWLAAYIPATGYAQLAATNTFTANQIISVNTSSDALKITQSGSGNALYIEDVAADATPFVVSSTGVLGIGTTTPDNVTSAGIALVSNSGYYPQLIQRNTTEDANASYLGLEKNRNGSIVQNGDILGNIVFRGYDGANYLQGAAMWAAVSNTPGTNDMPTDMVFGTTPDGASGITERLRIKNNGALAVNGAYGTSGQVLTSGGSGAAPTWASPAAGSGVVTAVASGSLANGATVILNSDGTVSAVAGSGITESLGTRTAFKTNTTEWTDCCYDSVNGKVVIVYRDNTNSYYGTAVVGTVSGTTISFGSPTVFSPAGATSICCTFNTTGGKVVVFFRSASDTYPYGVVGTVSGTSISFGSPTAVNSLSTEFLSCTYDSTNNKVVVCHVPEASQVGRAYVGTVSGTSISFGSAGTFNSTNAYPNSCCFDSSNGKVVVAFTDNVNGSYGTAVVGTVSGTSISFGTKTVFNSAVSDFMDVCFDNVNNKIIISYQDQGNSSYGTAVVGTVGGTGITFGSEFVFNAGSTPFTSCVFSSQKVVIFFDGGGAGSGKVIVGSVSGSVITFGTASTYNTGSASRNNCCYDSGNNKCVNVYTNAANAFGYAVVFQAPSISTNLTAKNFIGFSSASYTDGQTASISAVGSITTARSGLTTAQLYYAQYDGTLATTVNAESPSPYAGVSLSATSLLIKG